MKRSFSSVTKIAAPRDVVWSVMSDHERYARWGSAKTVTLEPEGSPDRNGVGAVRIFHSGPLKVREEVIEFEPTTRLVYRVVSGFPVRDYRSEMLLEADGVITVLAWRSTFEARIPGTGGIITRIMAKAVDGFAAGIKAEAEAIATASGEGAR